jgi:hypothetical protein
MGYSSGEGYELITAGRTLLCAPRIRRAKQHHIDVVGLVHQVESVRLWCRQTFGQPIIWLPIDMDAQWYNRFDTDLLWINDGQWAYRASPWVGGNIDNIHLVLAVDAAPQFQRHWASYFR